MNSSRLQDCSEPKTQMNMKKRYAGKLPPALVPRLKIVCEFFRYDCLPDSDAGWMRLLLDLCDHWQIPAFQILEKKARGPGASTKWTDRRFCELFADVQSLVKSSAMT